MPLILGAVLLMYCCVKRGRESHANGSFPPLLYWTRFPLFQPFPPSTPRSRSSLEKEYKLRMEEFPFQVKQVYMKFQKRSLETVILS